MQELRGARVAVPPLPGFRDLRGVIHTHSYLSTNASQIFGRPIAAPHLVGADVFERFLRSKLLTAQPAAKRIAYKQLSHYVKFLSIVEPLPTSLPNLPYDCDQTLAANVRYWCARNGHAKIAAA